MPDDTWDLPNPGKPMKIVFAPGETGWATYLGECRVRIDNIPLSENLNFDDVCEISKRTDGRFGVDRVLASTYEAKTTLRYFVMKEFHELRCVLNSLGCRVEGGVAPDENGSGLLLVAHPRRINPVLIAEGMGVKQGVQKKKGK